MGPTDNFSLVTGLKGFQTMSFMTCDHPDPEVFAPVTRPIRAHAAVKRATASKYTARSSNLRQVAWPNKEQH